MILGIGHDLVDIRRIEGSVERFGERYTHRVYTVGERALCDAREQRGASYAKRWAAKEACAKALGTGVPANAVHWQHIEVVQGAHGRPELKLTGGAADALDTLVPEGMSGQVNISISDDFPYASAFVVISAVPTSGK